jgi:hypothetical protein
MRLAALALGLAALAFWTTHAKAAGLTHAASTHLAAQAVSNHGHGGHGGHGSHHGHHGHHGHPGYHGGYSYRAYPYYYPPVVVQPPFYPRVYPRPVPHYYYGSYGPHGNFTYRGHGFGLSLGF